MAPRPRHHPVAGIDADRPIPAAVVALLFPGAAVPAADVEPGEPCLVLTRRTQHVAAHKGQICLPGGMLDPGEDAEAAALRELREELGVASRDVRLLGKLTPVFIPVIGFRMQPFVAATDAAPSFVPAAIEVDALIELPVRHLLDQTLRAEAPHDDGANVMVPHFAVRGERVWGATAMVLAELATLLEEIDANGWRTAQRPT